MKHGSNSKRSRGRGGGNGGRKPIPSRNQNYDSNGPNIRVRGNASQVMDKYLSLARDAFSQGDRVLAENYYQHAEHYLRIVNSFSAPHGQSFPPQPEPGQTRDEAREQDDDPREQAAPVRSQFQPQPQPQPVFQAQPSLYSEPPPRVRGDEQEGAEMREQPRANDSSGEEKPTSGVRQPRRRRTPRRVETEAGNGEASEKPRPARGRKRVEESGEARSESGHDGDSRETVTSS